MSAIITPDICDAHPEVQVLDPIFVSYGGREAFCGPIRTVKCFEDNSLVKQAVSEPGEGAVLVVDAGGSHRCAMLGDMLAEQAVDNGWSGVVMYGCVRDVDVLAETDLGVHALGAHPRKSEKRGEGSRDVAVTFAGVTLRPGQWLYADNNGIVVAEERLPLES
ncbi:ribonuclease E activity regulator RraA [Halomonas desiderata]|uniref:4-hydroxy-4-methyl-2-oxoglutarate aldolase n=2 Tax=Billgrantia TaxID=3137761 RepID=A0ABS8ZZU8_9GAMM|nr:MULTISPECIES: ribonuclease E activity regulator RraA [Halomonas]MCE8001807.1 ribonuclease E activity regulator RraA [Halomonas ethanolica]MCE8010843.1 ribonuclease E activity regulator RraA [Halomonas desiderata]MCE8051109.1 ribonuclease E activity regulator RraA [Halomonas desiderata]NIC35338.1 ribonuclease E activity regulator RraA [Halomonas desiderata]OUE42947.1 ribonuclease activity regulator protein RraA [Halomonas desiderata SP1]